MKKIKLLPEHPLYRYLVKASLVALLAYSAVYYSGSYDARLFRAFTIFVLGIYTLFATIRIDEGIAVITVPLAVIAWISLAFIPGGVAVLAHISITGVSLAILATDPFDSNREIIISRENLERARALTSVILVMGAMWWFFYYRYVP